MRARRLRPRCSLAFGAGAAHAQVTFERLLNPSPSRTTGSRIPAAIRANDTAALEQIRPSNVGELELKWVFQAQSLESFETTPLVVDGVMYLTEAPNTAVALDAATGRPFWRYQHNRRRRTAVLRPRESRSRDPRQHACSWRRSTRSSSRSTRRPARSLWQNDVADANAGYAMTLAPLVDEGQSHRRRRGRRVRHPRLHRGVRRATGEEEWRFYTIPAPGEPGFETWADGGDAWQHGGASVWLTGSYDAAARSHVLGHRQPGPGLESRAAARRQPLLRQRRRARSRYRRAQMALPVHAERRLRLRRGADPRARRPADRGVSSGKLMLLGNRNGFFYVLDRTTGEFIRGKPFVEGQLGERPRRERPADRDAAGLGEGHVSRRAGRHELVFAVVQPAHRALLSFRVGELRLRVQAGGDRVSCAGVRFVGGVPASPIPGSRTCPASAAVRSTTGRRRSATAR